MNKNEKLEVTLHSVPIIRVCIKKKNIINYENYKRCIHIGIHYTPYSNILYFYILLFALKEEMMVIVTQDLT